MSTYSLYTSTAYESTRWPISGTPSYFDYILDTSLDNLEKLVSPRDLRDMMLSLWSDTVFKETTASGSSTGYIGIDTGDPSDRDLKKTIYIGKRHFSGSTIMATASLTSDIDLFLYNTKSDLIDQDTTKVILLSGTAINNFSNMPYIQSQYVTGTTETLALSFISPIGDVNVTNEYGDIFLSGLSGSATVSVAFPTQTESFASASNNKVLKYDEVNSKLYWDDIVFPSVDYIGTTGSSLEIVGSPVLLNGYPIEFSDSRRCPVVIGDIVYGSSFSNIPISEILRRMIYDYLPPTCSIELLAPYESGYAEVGTYPTPTVQWTINKKTLPTTTTALTNMIPGAYSPIVTDQYSSVTSTSNGIVISPITTDSTVFTIQVTDGTTTNSASASLTGVYPYFYGFSSLSTMTTVGLGSLTKKIEPQSDKTYDFTGNGNMYFIYPKDYGTLSSIFDNYGNNCYASFSEVSQIFSSPTGLWASEEFWVYQWSGVSQIGPPSVNFEFKY